MNAPNPCQATARRFEAKYERSLSAAAGRQPAGHDFLNEVEDVLAALGLPSEDRWSATSSRHRLLSSMTRFFDGLRLTLPVLYCRTRLIIPRAGYPCVSFTSSNATGRHAGAEGHLGELSARLAADGHQVTVATTDALDFELFWEPRRRRVVARRGASGVRILRFPVRHLAPLSACLSRPAQAVLADLACAPPAGRASAPHRTVYPLDP